MGRPATFDGELRAQNCESELLKKKKKRKIKLGRPLAQCLKVFFVLQLTTHIRRRGSLTRSGSASTRSYNIYVHALFYFHFLGGLFRNPANRRREKWANAFPSLSQINAETATETLTLDNLQTAAAGWVGF
jgi:hypothetical protein